MGPQHASSGGMMARAVDEALASVTTPERARDAIVAALQAAGLEAVPERPSEAAAFVSGPLQIVLGRIFGPDTAEFVVESLRPVVEVASGYHPVQDDSEAPPPPRSSTASNAPEAPIVAPEGTPVVLVATLDRAGVLSIASTLEGRAEVRVVADAFEWLAGLDAFSERRLIAVLDCCLPAFDPLWAAKMAESMPPHADVILWGATDDVRESAKRLVGGSPRWHELGPDADAKKLAKFIESGI